MEGPSILIISPRTSQKRDRGRSAALDNAGKFKLQRTSRAKEQWSLTKAMPRKRLFGATTSA